MALLFIFIFVILLACGYKLSHRGLRLPPMWFTGLTKFPQLTPALQNFSILMPDFIQIKNSTEVLFFV